MSEITLDAVALQQLDEEPRRLLDAVDNLRYLGVDSYVELPQIIVVGDQSSGKSSVLEAISRVQFPARSGACTRFATELVLRTSPEPKVEICIVRPDQGGKGTSDEAFERFNKATIGPDELAEIIEEAKQHMGLDADSKAISRRAFCESRFRVPSCPG